MAEVTTLKDILYRADGAVLSRTSGNGVTQTYRYDPCTQRLACHTVQRPAGHPLGAMVISDLYYGYDPAGNILTLNEAATQTQWHRNRVTDGRRAYAYDTLYRLVSATGRERLADTARGPQARLQADGSGAGGEWFPYAERYIYDDGDNLIRTEHGGNSPWTRKYVVSAASNRAVRQSEDGTANPDDGFLPGGLQRRLADGRALEWYADGHLRQVTPVTRADAGDMDDTETYRYRNPGSRVRKDRTTKVMGVAQTHTTTYAGGAETRQRRLAGSLQLDIAITNASEVRLIKNRLTGENHLRYAFADHLNSSMGETDAEGSVTAREEYYPYGGSAGADEEAEEIHDRTLRYSGKERDATGLIYYGWRYYQPEAGRWLSADPGGLVDGVNLFRFCRDNPVCGYDDSGLVYQELNDRIEKKHIEGDGWDIIARGVEPQPVQGRRFWGKVPVYGLNHEERERLDNDLALARAMVLKTRTALEAGDYTGLERFIGANDAGISFPPDFIMKITDGYLKIENNIIQRESGGELRDRFIFARPKKMSGRNELYELNAKTNAMIFPDDQHKRILVNKDKMASLLPTTRAEKLIHEISHQELSTNDEWYFREVDTDGSDREILFHIESMKDQFSSKIIHIPSVVSKGRTEKSGEKSKWLFEQADTWALLPYFYLEERRYNNENNPAIQQGFTDKRMKKRYWQ